MWFVQRRYPVLGGAVGVMNEQNHGIQTCIYKSKHIALYIYIIPVARAIFLFDYSGTALSGPSSPVEKQSISLLIYTYIYLSGLLSSLYRKLYLRCSLNWPWQVQAEANATYNATAYAEASYTAWCPVPSDRHPTCGWTTFCTSWQLLATMMKHCKERGYNGINPLSTNWCRISQPSTVTVVSNPAHLRFLGCTIKGGTLLRHEIQHASKQRMLACV